MGNLPSKPEGSSIDEDYTVDGQVYRWMPPKAGAAQWFAVLFLSCWLCGWAWGWVSAVRQLLGGNQGPSMFLMFWLSGWTVGGAFAGFMLYVCLRKPRPESVTIGRDTLQHDPGSLSAASLNDWNNANRRANSQDGLTSLFKRRKPVEVSKSELAALKLDRVGERQRLYFDRGADRIEIGEHLREPDREWLAAVIEAWRDG